MFEQFSRHKIHDGNKVGTEDIPNGFFSLTEGDIAEAEHRMKLTFPSALRSFYKTIGHGQWRKGMDNDAPINNDNDLLGPSQSADLYLERLAASRTRLSFPKGHIPFLGIDSSTYL